MKLHPNTAECKTWPSDYSRVGEISSTLPISIVKAIDDAFPKENLAKHYARLSLIRIWTSRSSIAMSSVFASAMIGDHYRFKLFRVLRQLVALGVLECNEKFVKNTDYVRGYCKRYRKSTTNAGVTGVLVSVSAADVVAVLTERDETLALLGWDCGNGLDVTEDFAETLDYVDVSPVSKAEVVAHYLDVEACQPVVRKKKKRKVDPVADANRCWESLVRFDMRAFHGTKRKDGRVFHPLTAVPSELRQRFRMYDRPVVDVDDHASYWGTLVAYMPRCDERDMLISILQQGGMYSLLFDCMQTGGANLTATETKGSVAFKRHICGELIFTNWHAKARRSIRIAARTMLPRLSGYLESLHQWLSPSQISRRLTAVEGQITIDRVYRHLRDCNGIHVLPYHDGVLCADMHAEIAIERYRKASIQVRGFSSLVRSKTPDLTSDDLEILVDGMNI